MAENEVIDGDEAAARRIAAVFVAWNESGQKWRDYLAGLQEAAQQATEAYHTAVACVPPGGQLPLIPGAVAAPEPKKPRAKRRVIMHEHEDGNEWQCRICDAAKTIPADTSEGARKRGVPCPKCNAAEEVT